MSTPDNRFDELARAHASGLSRREVLRAGIAGALGFSVAAPQALAQRPPTVATCTLCTTWPRTRKPRKPVCAPCAADLPRHAPSPKKVGRLAQRNPDLRALRRLGVAHGFRVAGDPAVTYVAASGTATLTVILVQRLHNPTTHKSAAIFFGSHGDHSASMAVLVASTQDPASPVSVAIATSKHHATEVPMPSAQLHAALAAMSSDLRSSVDLGKCGACNQLCQDILEWSCFAGAEPIAYLGAQGCAAFGAAAGGAAGGLFAGGVPGAFVGAGAGGISAGLLCFAIGSALAWYVCSDLYGQISPNFCSQYVCSRVCCNSGLVLCNGTCIDSHTDAANCGQCGMSCPSGATCVGGQCKCPPGSEDCCGVCVVAGECCGCVECATPRTCCHGSICTNLMTDPGNCGACDHACGGGTPCIEGSCTPGCPGCTPDCCPPGWVLYDNLCVDPTFTCQNAPCTDAACCQQPSCE